MLRRGPILVLLLIIVSISALATIFAPAEENYNSNPLMTAKNNIKVTETNLVGNTVSI